jgi:hypothetical protein
VLPITAAEMQLPSRAPDAATGSSDPGASGARRWSVFVWKTQWASFGQISPAGDDDLRHPWFMFRVPWPVMQAPNFMSSLDSHDASGSTSMLTPKGKVALPFNRSVAPAAVINVTGGVAETGPEKVATAPASRAKVIGSSPPPSEMPPEPS